MAPSTRITSALYVLLSVSVATIFVVMLFVTVGVSPIVAARVFLDSSFGSLRTFGEGLIRATPLLLISVTILPSLRAGLYNIGAPGQVGVGALAATAFALSIPEAPSWLLISGSALAALVAGALAAAIPGYLKARWSANEIVTTLAMNFIVLALLAYLLSGPMQGDFANLPQSDSLPDEAKLPKLFTGTRAHGGIILALALVPLMILIDRSIIGYRLRLYSHNKILAVRAEISTKVYTIWLMALGGAGAGLAGWMQVAAIDYRLYPSVASPIGYAGLFVALLGGLHPVGCILAAYFMGALLYGGASLQIGAGVSPEVIQVFLGLVLLAYAASAARSK